MKKSSTIVATFLNDVAPAISAMDYATFSDTVDFTRYDPLFAHSWHRWIQSLINATEAAGLKPASIGALFPNPSEIRCKLIFDLWMARFANASVPERMRIFDFYASVLQAICIEDIFAARKNVTHSAGEVEKLVSALEIASPSDARQLGRLVSALYHFGHAVYSDMNPSIAYENYGPYQFEGCDAEQRILAIKDFSNLDASALWPGTNPLPFRRISIHCLYAGVKMSVDAASHALYEGDLINSLRRVSFVVDGRRTSPLQAKPMAELVEAQAEAIYLRFRDLPFEERKAKYILQKAFAYKPLRESLGLPWVPPEEVFLEARGKPLFEIRWPTDPAEQTEFVRSWLDPRTDEPLIL